MNSYHDEGDNSHWKGTAGYCAVEFVDDRYAECYFSTWVRTSLALWLIHTDICAPRNPSSLVPVWERNLRKLNISFNLSFQPLTDWILCQEGIRSEKEMSLWILQIGRRGSYRSLTSHSKMHQHRHLSTPLKHVIRSIAPRSVKNKTPASQIYKWKK